MRNLLVNALFAVVLFANSAFAADPLPSWNDGKAKQSIVNFVTKVTTYIPHEHSDDFAFRQALKFRSWYCSREQSIGAAIKQYYAGINGMF